MAPLEAMRRDKGRIARLAKEIVAPDEGTCADNPALIKVCAVFRN